MNDTLAKLTIGATFNVYGELIQQGNTIKNPIIDHHKKESVKEINKFRDNIRKELKLNSLFIYYIAVPNTLLLICEIDKPEELNNKKLGRLLNILDIYNYRKIKSDKELFLVFDILNVDKKEVLKNE